jgi:hypothetical protein
VQGTPSLEALKLQYYALMIRLLPVLCSPTLPNASICRNPLQGTPSLEALKLQYYALMIRFYQHEATWLEVCRCYR